MKPIRVLIVDDSALMRKLLSELLSSDPEIEVVGTAPDAFVAREKIKQLNPDVLTLDIEMPGMNGLTFLNNLMRLRPMPVLMVSALTEKGAKVTMQALELGAADFVGKPKMELTRGLRDCAEELIAKVKTVSTVSIDSLVARSSHHNGNASEPSVDPRSANQGNNPVNRFAADKIVAIGASTGGTEAVREVLVNLPPDVPGTVVTIHIPPMFSRTYAERLDRETQLAVCEAEDGQEIWPGHVYIAPGDRHLLVARSEGKYRCQLSDAAPVNRHRPAIDLLFESVAQSAGRNSLGLIMTGMGKDGASGLCQMKAAGARTIAQDEETSVVWGMPRAAAEMGGADEILPLQQIASRLGELFELV